MRNSLVLFIALALCFASVPAASGQTVTPRFSPSDGILRELLAASPHATQRLPRIPLRKPSRDLPATRVPVKQVPQQERLGKPLVVSELR